MKFFRRKDKKKDDGNGNGNGNSGHGRMPGFGSFSSSSNGKQSASAHSGYGFGQSGARPDRNRPFGSPPLGSYDDHDPRNYSQSARFQPRPTRVSAALLARLPEAAFKSIFAFVCPHSVDESYATCEQSSVEDGCMLCDLRDLARCVAVCRRWRTEAVKLLYVRIVHPCPMCCRDSPLTRHPFRRQIPQHPYRQRPLLRSRGHPGRAAETPDLLRPQRRTRGPGTGPPQAALPHPS